jgi:4-hydroxy-tetrahydrodipicolinate synthase
MAREQLRRALKGVSFTTATPFSEDGDRVLTDRLAENVRELYDEGARTFVPCGNTGEYYALSESERVSVVRTTVDALPDDATVVAGAGGSVGEARDLFEAYETAGADAAMVMYPGHTYVHEQGLSDYYRTLAESTDLGIVLYKRGPLLSETVLDTLSQVENVVAVKFAVNDVSQFSRLTESVSGDVEWINGVAERYALAYAVEGADGFTTGIGNFVPDWALSLFDALSAGDWERARTIRDALRPLEELRDEAGGGPAFVAAKNVPVVKYGLDSRGMYGGPVRPPLVELSAADRDRVDRCLERLSGTLDGPE